MMAFIWIALVYVIVAFADITAGSFVSAVDEIKGVKVDFNPGGAVASASVFYLAAVDRDGRGRKIVQTAALAPDRDLRARNFCLVVWMGTQFSGLFAFDAKTWVLIICGYCFFASLCPVWAALAAARISSADLFFTRRSPSE